MATVGTTPYGWPELVSEVENYCTARGLRGCAQIGNSQIVPLQMDWVRFMARERLLQLITHADLVVTHGGFGAIGDGLRHARRLVVVPRHRGRRGQERVAHPNDQWPVAVRLGSTYGFPVVELAQLHAAIDASLAGPSVQYSVVESNIPHLLREFVEPLAAEVARTTRW